METLALQNKTSVVQPQQAQQSKSLLSTIGSAVPIVGGLISALGNIGADKRQLRQQEKLNQMAEGSSMRLADHQAELAYQQWLKTNISKQKELYEQAGMNPALMYGESGATGTTGGISTPTVGAAQAANSAQTGANSIGMGMAIANLGLIKAQTEKTEAEAEKISGADTELTNSIIDLNAIEKSLQGQSLEYKLDILAHQKYMAEDEASIMQDKRQISNETVRQEIDKATQSLTNMAIQAVAMEQGVALDKAKIEEITASIQQRWTELNIENARTRYEHQDRLKSIEEYTSTTLKAAGIMAVGNVVGDIAQIASRRLPNTPEPQWRQTDKRLKTEYGSDGQIKGQTRYEGWQKK